MGLDMVELLMAVEETFEIEIGDEEFQSVSTVGDLHGLVMTKIEARSSQSKDPIECAKVPTFNRLRRAFIDVASVARGDVRPAVPIDSLVAAQGRRVTWARLAERSGLALPDLNAPTWLVRLALALSATVCLTAYVSYSLTWTLVLVFGGVMLVILKATKPLQVELPEGITTVGDLTRTVAARNHTLVARGRRYASPDQIWDALVEVIVGQLSVERSRIKPGARFAEDLRVD